MASTRAPTRLTRSPGCSRTCRATTARSASGESPIRGFIQPVRLVHPHPALVAASPQAPVTDWFVGDDWHHNGALQLTHAFNFLAHFGHPRPEPTSKPSPTKFDHGTPDAYQFFFNIGPLSQVDARYFKGDVAFWNDLMAHGTYDAFWKARNLRPHLKNVPPSVAVLTVGGWFDAENLFGALQTYRTIETTSPKTSNRLVLGPWLHGGWGRSDGSSLGPVHFAVEDRRLLPRENRVPVLRAPPQGQAAGRGARGVGLRDRPQPVAGARRLAAEECAPGRALFSVRWRAPLRSARRSPMPRTPSSATPRGRCPSSTRSTST